MQVHTSIPKRICCSFSGNTLEKNIVSYIEKSLFRLLCGHSNCLLKQGYGKVSLLIQLYNRTSAGTFSLTCHRTNVFAERIRLNHYGNCFLNGFIGIPFTGKVLPISDKMSMSGKKIDRN